MQKLKAKSEAERAKFENLASFVVKEARRLGATDCDVGITISEAVESGIRLEEVEELQGADGRSLTFRAFVGRRSATTGTTDLRRSTLTETIRDTIAMARASGEDPFSGLPEPGDLATSTPELDLYDPGFEKLDAVKQIELGLQAERAAFAVDPRIKNSEGAGFSSRRALRVYGNSLGFLASYTGTRFSLSASVVASDEDEKKVGYWYTSSRSLNALESPDEVGRKAANRALAQLGARKVKSQRVPVVYDRIMASRLIGQFVSAASGSHIYRNSSFLVGKKDEEVANSIVNIIDDGRISGGLYSRPFDGEGLPTGRRMIVEEGKLVTYLLSSYAARRLNERPNGGSTSNLYLEKGSSTPDEIIASVENGLYLTSVSGMGFNPATGDYSLGASGMWIENGKLAYPVSEITIASNMEEMFKGIEMIGDDLELRSSANSPTIKIKEMMVAGE